VNPFPAADGLQFVRDFTDTHIFYCAYVI